MSRADDPRPQEPVEPDLSECCGSGCPRCVFDAHAEALQRYREALTAWDRRQQLDPGGSGDPQR